MAITRRQLCSVGTALVIGGTSGCIGVFEGAESRGAGDDGGEYLDDWEWSGSIPIDSVVQHNHPDCGCCSDYVDYLEMHDIEVQVENWDSPGDIKDEFGVPEDAESCHTIQFGDYLVEGHVPLEAIERLYEDGLDVDGIAAPEMPENSPGMGPPSDEPLLIYSFEATGEVTEYVEVKH